MITMQIATSTNTRLIELRHKYKDREEIETIRMATDVLPKYTLAFGYDKETSIEKIKQLVSDIKSGDFTKSSKDYGHPKVVVEANRAYYASLKGRRFTLFLKTDTHWAYHAEGFVPTADDLSDGIC